MSACEKIKIMIVDDVEINRIILHEILSDTYEIEQASDGIDAISQMLNSIIKPNLLLLDIMMPRMDGFGVLRFMKSNSSLKKIPVIFITAADAERKGLSAGAVDYISKPFQPDIVRLRVSNHIELSLYRDKLENLVDQKATELISTKERFLETIANLIEYRSLESGLHVKCTRELAKILVMNLLRKERNNELLGSDYNLLIKAVPLHDVGKIGIPDNILLKRDKLTPEEFKIIETHTIIGGEVIKSLMSEDVEDEYLKYCYDICRYHHERWDGTGYPDGLSGTDIPLSARIVTIVDVYDALVSERCYKKAFSHEKSLDIIQQSAGLHFDPEIVSVLMEVQEEFKNYKNN